MCLHPCIRALLSGLRVLTSFATAPVHPADDAHHAHRGLLLAPARLDEARVHPPRRLLGHAVRRSLPRRGSLPCSLGQPAWRCVKLTAALPRGVYADYCPRTSQLSFLHPSSSISRSSSNSVTPPAFRRTSMQASLRRSPGSRPWRRTRRRIEYPVALRSLLQCILKYEGLLTFDHYYPLPPITASVA